MAWVKSSQGVSPYIYQVPPASEKEEIFAFKFFFFSLAYLEQKCLCLAIAAEEVQEVSGDPYRSGVWRSRTTVQSHLLLCGLLLDISPMFGGAERVVSWRRQSS